MNQTLDVAVVGATGYTGAEICSLLERHPRVTLRHRFGGARPFDAAALEALLAAPVDVVFLATPHEAAAGLAPRLLEAGSRVIDLSGAFRLKDPAAYARWYGFTHPAPALLGEAVYGLAEWCGPSLPGARLVANPGCYATSALLALIPLMPLLEHRVPIVCDAKSGVSGAGRSADPAYSFAEVSGNFSAYAVEGHRHEPEIRQAAGLDPGRPFLFVPHLLPVVRGILSTLYLTFRDPVTPGDVAGVFDAAYTASPCVRLLAPGQVPDIRSVAGTPRCDIGFVLRDDGRRAVVVSALDNLMKGAASQAVQNLNRMHGFDEREGLL